MSTSTTTSLGQLLREKLAASTPASVRASLFEGMLYTEEGRAHMLAAISRADTAIIHVLPVRIKGTPVRDVGTCWAVEFMNDYEDATHTEYFFSREDAAQAFRMPSAGAVGIEMISYR